MIFVKNINSVKNQEWATSEKYPGLRWKFLVDADFNGSKGLSCGFAEILPGGNLTLHHHEPDEIYVVTQGSATLDKSGELEEIKKGDVVYIQGNSQHALKNNSNEIFGMYWIFPTDRYKDVEYFSDE
jgi:quercetin dioxygenase-like cupin family protein